MNNDSTDNSTIIINNSSENFVELFSMLRKEVCLLDLESDESDETLEVIDVVEAQIKSEKLSKKVLSTLINSLPKAVILTKSALSIIEILQSKGII